MNRVYRTSTRAGYTLLCLLLVLWSALPSYSHAPSVFETIEAHLEMAADHGHSHGLEEDLYWAMHGHSHDISDHDHSSAFLLPGFRAGMDPPLGKAWRMAPTIRGPDRHFPIERPPRV